MGARIHGLIQAIRYGSSSERLFFRPKIAGVDFTKKEGSKVYITIYDSAGNEKKAKTELTVDGSGPWYYIDLNASATATWALGFDYRAELEFTDADGTYRDQIPLDVVRWPFNDPLVVDQDIDDIHPTWAGARPAGWSDFSKPICAAHVELVEYLRELKDNAGNRLYGTRVLNRHRLRSIELALAERNIAVGGLRLSDEEKKRLDNVATAELAALGELIMDFNDDLSFGQTVVDENGNLITDESDDVVFAGTRFVR